jgi:hypothetical protein
MANEPGDPDFGEQAIVVPPTLTEFERIIQRFNLQPDQYSRSTQLREWANRNKNSKYIPESLLKTWGFDVEWTL